ncbi:MAG: hypothetical protein OCD76_17475 [Reichenbachiella sp.]
MNLNQILIFLLLILFFVTAEFLNLPAHQVNFYFALTFFLTELIAIIRFNNSLKKCKFSFQLSSNEWLGGLVVTGFLIYSFSSAEMNTMNVLAMVLTFNGGGLYANLNKRKVYIVSDTEVIELNRDKRFNISDITEVESDNHNIAIHTNEFRNHITLTSKQLSFPTLPKLRNELNGLIKKEANNL